MEPDTMKVVPSESFQIIYVNFVFKWFDVDVASGLMGIKSDILKGVTKYIDQKFKGKNNNCKIEIVRGNLKVNGRDEEM